MRMEDLDHGRVRQEYLRTQLLDLRWLGLDWDEGPDMGGPSAPYLQSERVALYEDALELLEAKGRLYRCYCTRKEIAAAASAPHALDEEEPPYPGTCRERPHAAADRRVNAALRFRVADQEIRFTDSVYGDQVFNPGRTGGDFVVRRKDGVAAYQLAVVVDDAAMRVTDVVRGADLLTSTSRQILLYEALRLSPPRWAHVPLILGNDGQRLAKRSGAMTLKELRLAGTKPERLVGWLASTCGLAQPGAEMMPEELIEGFRIETVAACNSAVELPTWLRREKSAG
jgi:glutamyl-tRNA synthetase